VDCGIDYEKTFFDIRMDHTPYLTVILQKVPFTDLSTTWKRQEA